MTILYALAKKKIRIEQFVIQKKNLGTKNQDYRNK